MEIKASKKEWEILAAAVSTWGKDAQAKMLLEEMAELQKEICKAWRGKDNEVEIAEEVADVEVMLAQIKMIFGIDASVGVYRDAKIERLRQRLIIAGWRRITRMADILECIAGVLWIALGIYTWLKVHRLNKRLDDVLNEMTEEIRS